MSISSVTSSTAAYSNSGVQNRRSDFKQLASALSSGDLSSAQQAFATLQKDLQGQAGNASASNSSTNKSSGLSDGLSAIGQALQNGDLSGAQKAFASFAQQVGGGHHRHHHHSDDTGGAGQAAAPTVTPSSDTGLGTTIDTTA